jgi:hypothetical protein
MSSFETAQNKKETQKKLNDLCYEGKKQWKVSWMNSGK